MCVCVCFRAETPLTLAATELRQPQSMLIALVEGGAHLDYRNKHGLTPMHKAAITGRREPIQVSHLIVKVKVKMHTLDIAPLHSERTTTAEALIWYVFSSDLAVLPAHPHVHPQSG